MSYVLIKHVLWAQTGRMRQLAQDIGALVRRVVDTSGCGRSVGGSGPLCRWDVQHLLVTRQGERAAGQLGRQERAAVQRVALGGDAPRVRQPCRQLPFQRDEKRLARLEQAPGEGDERLPGRRRW
ncbi:hypothetical protein ACWEGQ_22020 [Streptomyces seoulensis]